MGIIFGQYYPALIISILYLELETYRENTNFNMIQTHLYFIPKVSIRYAITKAALRKQMFLGFKLEKPALPKKVHDIYFM